MKSIDVLISTYGKRIYNILPKLKAIEGVNYLIGHQGYSDEEFITLANQHDYIQYYPLTSQGVTISRNFLISQAKSDIIYFCDDDVEFIDEALTKLLAIHKNSSADLIITSVLNENYVPRKNYPLKITKMARTKVFSVGTVEISAKRASIQASNIQFSEDMGAGNQQFPIGDEAVFLADALDAGLSIITYPLSVVMHAQESSGNVVTNNVLNAIGLTISRVYKRQIKMFSLIIIFAYLVRFILRKGIFTLNTWKQAKQIIMGYQYR